MEFNEIDFNNGVPQETVEDLLFLSLLPLASEYDEERIQVFFSECLAALELGIGKLYVLSERNKHIAYSFIFDGDDSEEGAPHIHIVTVHKSKQRSGYGGTLMRELIRSRGKEGFTLECKERTIPFFESNGFSLSQVELDNIHFAMTYGLGSSRPRFKRPSLDDSAYNRYSIFYKRTAHRLQEKGFIRLGSV
ncbi:GNAT family N-acetyltransferase [Neptuniibacter sp. QD37_6]|uniref:GNAT family N-acetyltransferase n=1 Tax=Neptuniibacter sp. QD37_6 TaxID=3398210 RepID=UPI0039F58123